MIPGPQTWASVADATTTNTPTGVALRDRSSASPAGSARIPVRSSGPLAGKVKNTGGANVLTARVTGYQREDSPEAEADEIVAAFDVAADAVGTFELAQCNYPWIEVQVEAKVDGSQTTAAVELTAKPV